MCVHASVYVDGLNIASETKAHGNKKRRRTKPQFMHLDMCVYVAHVRVCVGGGGVCAGGVGHVCVCSCMCVCVCVCVCSNVSCTRVRFLAYLKVHMWVGVRGGVCVCMCVCGGGGGCWHVHTALRGYYSVITYVYIDVHTCVRVCVGAYLCVCVCLCVLVCMCVLSHVREKQYKNVCVCL